MKELQLGVLKGYNKDIFRAYAPDVKSFMEAKEVPNHVRRLEHAFETCLKHALTRSIGHRVCRQDPPPRKIK